MPAERTRLTDGRPPDSTELSAGSHYFRLWLAQMFLKNDRNWFANWHPAVHSAITFDFGDQSKVITNVTGPSTLKDIDAGHLDRFITFNRQLTTLLPFNGGAVGIDAGLLAMKGKDDVRDLIKTMSDFGALLVVPQLSAAMAVAGPLADAVGALVGATDGQLVIGLNQTFRSAGGRRGGGAAGRLLAAVDSTEQVHHRDRPSGSSR